MTTPGFRDPALREAFQRRGFVIVPLLEADEVAAVAETFDPGDLGAYPFSASIMSADIEERQRIDHRLQQRLRPKLEALLDGYRICFCNFTLKPAAQEAGAVEVHQDWSFVDERRFEPVGVWCPLVDVTPDNGCLFVVPGSHQLTSQPRTVLSNFSHPEISDLIDGALVPLPMPAGYGVLFSQRLFHASPPNRSRAPRAVACATLVPVASRTMCYYPDESDGAHVLAFEVDDAFYTRYRIGDRPAGEPVARLPVAPERIDRSWFAEVVRAASGRS